MKFYATVHPDRRSNLCGKMFKTRPCNSRNSAEKSGWKKAGKLSANAGGPVNAAGWEVIVRECEK